MAVLGVYEIDPPFPATAVHADAVRFYCNNVWVDHTGDRPTDQEVLNMSVLSRYAQEKRHRVEEGGFLHGNLRIAMDDEAMILTLIGAATMGDAETITFIENGINYGNFTGVQVRHILQDMKNFMASTFAVLGTVMADIMAGTITTTAEIDAAAWPS